MLLDLLPWALWFLDTVNDERVVFQYFYQKFRVCWTWRWTIWWTPAWVTLCSYACFLHIRWVHQISATSAVFSYCKFRHLHHEKAMGGLVHDSDGSQFRSLLHGSWEQSGPCVPFVRTYKHLLDIYQRAGLDAIQEMRARDTNRDRQLTIPMLFASYRVQLSQTIRYIDGWR